MIPTLLRELIQAWRHARRTPFTTTASVLTLALGIGATTLLYGLLYGIVQRPLPYPDPASLVQISSTRDEGGIPGGFSLAEFRDWQDESRSYASLALFAADQVSVLLPRDHARPVQGAVVSSDFFSLLGNPMRVGRPLTTDDDTLPAVVISERLWRTRLNADPDVLESIIVIDGQPVTIIGVADRTLAIPDDRTDLWLPVGFRRATAPPAWNMRGFRAFSVIARLESGMSLVQARDEAARIVAGWRERYPRFSENLAATVDGLRERLYGDAAPGLWLLLGCVGGAMLIAVFNVAGLLVARDASRQRETAVRRALGAGPGRLWRQSMTDSALLAAIGTTAGIVGADLGLQWLRARPPAGLPRLPSVVMDAPVLAVAVAIGTGVMLLLGTMLGWRG
jgi:predicted permease